MDASRQDLAIPTGSRSRSRLSAGRRRRRRPSGEPPALPRELGRSGRFWVGFVIYCVVTFVAVALWEPLSNTFADVQSAIMRGFVSLRTDAVVDGALAINLLASAWTIRVIRWSVIITLIVSRRWRHLLVFLGATLALEILVSQTALHLASPRPLDVTILGPWTDFSAPSMPLAGLAVSLVGFMYAVIPHGRARNTGKWIVAAILALLIVARMILALEYLAAGVFGAVLGVAVGLAAFRLLTPNEVFPVSYRRGKAAHLDVGGRRGEAIKAAVLDQIGSTVVEIRPIGLEGSGGSTPLRLTLDLEGERRYVFAKLYAMSHVRADRWYKLGRTILYGALEDETPFGSVRRFVEYEDYALRLLYDEGFASPEPLGVVEITPEREYMILMEFFDGAVEISEGEVTDEVIDEGLQLIRRLWHVGVAHRDVKPANLMIQDGHLRLIDVFFVQVRPSPWRQAVDLANMMLVLALRSDPERVYEHAQLYFTPEEIAEAFAAARGVASPTQLRAMVKADERDLIGRFRELAPARDPVKIQRWSARRVLLTAWVAVLGLVALALVTSNWAVFA